MEFIHPVGEGDRDRIIFRWNIIDLSDGTGDRFTTQQCLLKTYFQAKATFYIFHFSEVSQSYAAQLFARDNAEYWDWRFVFSAYSSSDEHRKTSSAPTNDSADLSHHPENETADFDMAVVSPTTLAFSHLHILKGKFQINVRNWRCTEGLKRGTN